MDTKQLFEKFCKEVDSDQPFHKIIRVNCTCAHCDTYQSHLHGIVLIQGSNAIIKEVKYASNASKQLLLCIVDKYIDMDDVENIEMVELDCE